jgi:hypothetical protein
MPKLAEGDEMWLGNGFYFWQDEYFAKWWGSNKKCGGKSKSAAGGRYTIYRAEIEVADDEFYDTVFDEETYNHFVESIEKFAKEAQKGIGRKPTLLEFNRFIRDKNIWNSIKVIRFQDLPESNEHIEVLGYFYKKRIQLRVNDPEVITKFVVHKNMACI